MIKLISQSGRAAYGVCEYLIDFENELQQIPNWCSIGSTVIVVETGKKYIKTSVGEWIIDPESVGGSGGNGSIQSDWNQNDESANDHIKNRPFYEIPEEVVIVSDYTFTDNDVFTSSEITSGLYAGLIEYRFSCNQETKPEVYANILKAPIVIDAYYRVTINDEVYEVQAYQESNGKHLDGYYTGVLEFYCPFSLSWWDKGSFNFAYCGEHKPTYLKVEQIVSNTVINTVDDKFIPDTIARISDVTNLSTKVDALSSEAYQSDWLEDNATSSTYIKNRPFYESKKKITAIDYHFAEDDSFSVSTTINVKEFLGQPFYFLKYEAMMNSDKFNSIVKNNLVAGADYIVTIDDKVYTLTSTGSEIQIYLAGSELEPPLPFDIIRGAARGGNIQFTFYGSKPSYLKVEQITDEVELVQIDEKFIPNTIARKSDVISFAPQTLTDEQKAQARANIGIDELSSGVTEERVNELIDIAFSNLPKAEDTSV